MNQKKIKTLNVYTDGGSRGNPGPGAIGVYITDQHHQKIYSFGKAIGRTTNNIAEYKAVIAALSFISLHLGKDLKCSAINFFLDSLFIVSQINGVFKVKSPHIRQLLFEVREKESQISVPIRYSHIPRSKNEIADSLVNSALDMVQ